MQSCTSAINISKQGYARHFQKVLRYQYLLEKGNVGTGTMFEKYHGIRCGTFLFLMIQLNGLRIFKERLFIKKTVIFREKSTTNQDYKQPFTLRNDRQFVT